MLGPRTLLVLFFYLTGIQALSLRRSYSPGLRRRFPLVNDTGAAGNGTAANGTVSHNATATPFVISSLRGHYMGVNSGLPGGSWPPGTTFNTSVVFTVAPPNATNTTVTCSTEWPNHVLPPTKWTSCDDQYMRFRFRNGSRGPYDFTLDLVDAARSPHAPTFYQGSVHVTANNASSATNYLSCIGGAPLTGITCNIGGPLAPGKTSITVPLSIIEPLAPFHIFYIQTNSPSGRPGQPCEPSFSMSLLAGTAHSFPTTTCSTSWTCGTNPEGCKQCNGTSTSFEINVPEGGNPLREFNLSLAHAYTSLPGVTALEPGLQFIGKGSLALPGDLEWNTNCGASGACQNGLQIPKTREESPLVLIVDYDEIDWIE